MLIKKKNCINCRKCIPYCVVGAIKVKEKSVYIEKDRCVDCYVCYRNSVCSNNAIEPSSLDSLIENLIHVLSDPTTVASATEVAGRGTEEVKSNDFTQRIKAGEIGICIDMGRPGVGCYFKDVEKLIGVLLDAGLQLGGKEENPLFNLMDSNNPGKMKEEYLQRFVLSAIIEGKCKIHKMGDIMDALKKVEGELETVFCLGLILTNNKNDEKQLKEILEEKEIPFPFRGKVNMGFAAL